MIRIILVMGHRLIRRCRLLMLRCMGLFMRRLCLWAVPGAWVVHTGNSWSFVYDVADLYKAEITIPAAFEVVAGYTEGMDIGSVTRRAVRDRIRSEKVMERVVRDIQRLLVPEELPEEMLELDVVGLWNEQGEAQRGGMNYGDGGAD